MDFKTGRRGAATPPITIPHRFSEASVADWLAALPLANRDLSVDALLAFLNTFNEQGGIACGERLAILERLWPVAEMLMQSCMRGQTADEAFPLPQSAQRFANRCFQVAYELGNGYRRIATDSAFMSEWVMAEQGRSTVLLRFSQYYGRALLRLRVCYQPAPCGFWRNLYQVYRLAETNQLLQGHADPGDGTAAVPVMDHFLALLLFSLAPTNRHRPQSIRQIFGMLQRFCGYADLRRESQLNDQAALFVLDLDSDGEPRRLLQREAGRGGDLRFLFTRALIDRMLVHFSSPAGLHEIGGGLSGGLVKRLVRSLGVPEQRKSLRIADSGERRVIVGLRNLIESLWRGRPPEDLLQSTTVIHYKGVKWLNVPDLQIEQGPRGRAGGAERLVRSEHSVGSTMAGRNGTVSREDIWGGYGFAGPSEGADAAVFSASTINSSAHGYCLLWTNKTFSCLKVGVLIGFPNDGGWLHLGVIRWLQQTDEGEVMMGVELIAPKIKAVTLYASGRGPERALFVPEDPRFQREPAIFVAPAKFDVGQVLTIDDAAGVANYRVERLLESSPSFQHFILAEAEVGVPAAPL